jgi:protoheme ferro-lyase
MLSYNSGFHQRLHYSIINRFPKLSYYPPAKESAVAAVKAATISAARNSVLYAFSSFSSSTTDEDGLQQF